MNTNILLLSHLVGVDNQDCSSVDLLDLLWGNQVGHAHSLPARLPFPQHCVHGGQQSADVTLLPLNPVQNLGHKQGETEKGHISMWEAELEE